MILAIINLYFSLYDLFRQMHESKKKEKERSIAQMQSLKMRQLWYEFNLIEKYMVILFDQCVKGESECRDDKDILIAQFKGEIKKYQAPLFPTFA